MEALLRKQLHRQAVLQERVVLPAGRVVSKEEGRAAAKRTIETITEDEMAEVKATTSAPSAVVLEKEVSKKIVALRQKGNKRENLQAALESFREDCAVAKLVDNTAVRAAAEKLYSKASTDHKAIRKDRELRALHGPAKAAKKKKSGKKARA